MLSCIECLSSMLLPSCMLAPAPPPPSLLQQQTTTLAEPLSTTNTAPMTFHHLCRLLSASSSMCACCNRLPSDAGAFFTFLLFVVLSANAAISLGYGLSALAKNVSVALALGCVRTLLERTKQELQTPVVVLHSPLQ